MISDPARKFVREGFLKILGLEDLRSAYFFLLNDMVLYCKYKPGGKYAREFKFKVCHAEKMRVGTRLYFLHRQYSLLLKC